MVYSTLTIPRDDFLQNRFIAHVIISCYPQSDSASGGLSSFSSDLMRSEQKAGDGVYQAKLRDAGSGEFTPSIDYDEMVRISNNSI